MLVEAVKSFIIYSQLVVKRKKNKLQNTPTTSHGKNIQCPHGVHIDLKFVKAMIIYSASEFGIEEVFCFAKSNYQTTPNWPLSIVWEWVTHWSVYWANPIMLGLWQDSH